MAAESVISLNDDEYEVLACLLNGMDLPTRLTPAWRSLRKKVERS